MNLTQTKIVGLTMQLDLKAKEYNMLCMQFDELDSDIANKNNDKQLKELKEKFEKNHDEIQNIIKQLESIEDIENAE